MSGAYAQLPKAPRVVLVGLPGVGKSTVGAELAALLSVDFADSDDLIIEMTGRSIGEIFADDGEAVFRDIEAAAITDALLDFDGVLALGGGAVTTESVRDALRDTGVPVVLLTAAQEQLLARMVGSTHRPLLAGDAEARLAALAEVRGPLYREVATLIVETDYGTASDVAADIETQLAGSGDE